MFGRLLPEGSKARRLIKRWLFDPVVPKPISKNFISLDESQLDEIAESLRRNYFSQVPDGWLSSEVGRHDLQAHLLGRLEIDRRYRIPWLDHAKSLSGSKVLEIGCGTGSSTVALAEQGANVVGIDISDLALTDARKRCEVYGLNVDFVKCNVTDVANLFSGEKFDFIIFWASLEHMTFNERLSAMADTWQMLPPESLWCVTETPNRLWFHDGHTSLMPFFMWLPDELAIKYARFSPRQSLKDALAEEDAEDLILQLARQGRGVSFHEFALSIGPPSDLDIVSSLDIFNRSQRLLARLKWSLSSMHRYEVFLKKCADNVHIGFFQSLLDLIIRKH